MDPGIAALLTEQLSERAARDPVAALVLQQLSRPAESTRDDDPDRLLRRLKRALQVIGGLRAQLAAADTMAVHVARLLGACPACWGLDALCRQCLGAGTPGSQQPDADGLVAWVAPALERAGLTVSPVRPAEEQAGRPRRSGHAGTGEH